MILLWGGMGCRVACESLLHRRKRPLGKEEASRGEMGAERVDGATHPDDSDR